MKLLRKLSRQFRDACKSVFRNGSLSISSISCISITLILVGVSVILRFNVNNFSHQIEDTMTITVFIEREADVAESESVGYKIEELDNIAEVDFVTKEKIKEDLQKDSTILGQVIGTWDEKTNPLQDEYIVSVEDINKISETAKSIEKLEYVDLVKYGEGMVENLVSMFDVVEKIMTAIVIALILVTAFLISNTIKITINSRKREISIRRLVGASNAYIKTPFFFEGIILGLFGSLIPIALCGYGYIFMYKKLEGHLFTPIISLVSPEHLLLQVVILILIIAIAVGAFGSYRAVKKYLKI